MKWHSFKLWKTLLITETKSILRTSWPVARVKGLVQKLMNYWLSHSASPSWQFELQMQKLFAVGGRTEESRNIYHGQAMSMQSRIRSMNSAADYCRAVLSLESLTRSPGGLFGPIKASVSGVSLKFTPHCCSISVCTISSTINDLIE